MNNNSKFVVVYLSIITIASAASLYASRLNSPKVFVFTWPKEEQDIINGTLRIEMSFQWKGESLKIIAKINDKLGLHGYLGLVFDRNGNGEIDYWETDKPYMLQGNNMTAGAGGAYLLPRNSSAGPDYPEGKGGYLRGHCTRVSPYHTAMFIEDVGWLYDISIPKGELTEVRANVVYIVYLSNTYAFASSTPLFNWVTAEAAEW